MNSHGAAGGSAYKRWVGYGVFRRFNNYDANDALEQNADDSVIVSQPAAEPRRTVCEPETNDICGLAPIK